MTTLVACRAPAAVTMDRLAHFKSQIEDYLDFIVNRRKRQPSTARNYGGILSELVGRLRSEGLNLGPQNLDRKMLMEFAETSQIKSKLSQGRIAVRVICLRGFYKFLRTQKKIAYDPDQELDSVAKETRLPRPLPEKEVARLFSAPDTTTDLGLRDRLGLELLYGSGLRISELLGLKAGDLQVNGRKIGFAHVIGKGNKQRIVPISKESMFYWRKYLALRDNPSESEPLFLSQTGKPLIAKNFQVAFKKHLASAKLNMGYTCHQLRHSFATHLFDHGADIRLIQELLGHSSVATTQLYTKVGTTKIKRDYLRFHPRSWMKIPKNPIRA